MSRKWPKVRVGEVLFRSEETINPKADSEYREVKVRLWGNGIVERRRVSGAQITGRRFVARSGQFIASRIDARNGAMGLVPPSLDGAMVTNDFPLFNLDTKRLEPSFLGWLCRTIGFIELCKQASEGTTNRVRLKEDRFLSLEIPLPPLSEQKRIVARIEELSAKIAEARSLRKQEECEMHQILLGVFRRIINRVPRYPLREIAPLIRRKVKVDPFTLYPELGIRSFGKGTFHKPALTGIEIGNKRVFYIEPEDLLFNNVFAWEGAIAVAKPQDKGRIGSHRFITCVSKPEIAITSFLCFYFLTKEGLELIGAASPGGAGRNRTLGLSALGAIKVPVPPIEHQKWFDSLLAEADSLKRLQADTAAELDDLLPSIHDKAFKGEL